MKFHLYEGEWLHAVHMWRNGCDTLKISQYFDCKESFIYRWLPVYRKKFSGVQEKAA